jgi:hypothetical protein
MNFSRKARTVYLRLHAGKHLYSILDEILQNMWHMRKREIKLFEIVSKVNNKF